MFTSENRKPLIGFAAALVIVCSVCLLARAAFADEAPPPQVEESAASIQRNQKRIAELRPLVEEFELLKSDNAKLQGRMEAFGWSYDWATNQPVKLDPK